jgi:ABC-type nickel/cobalt efflux system permease component RcnA
MFSPHDLGTALPAALGLSLLLGLRHALDPDHLVAVSTLVAGARERGARSAGRLGAAWGAGHALTLLAFGLPILLAGVRLPERLQALAEVAIGALILLLALQVLLRWRRGAFHAHAHEHEHSGLHHAHVHTHALSARHGHEHAPPRSPRTAFLVGCLHGTGGSAAVTILVLSVSSSRERAAAALLVLAAGAGIAMAVLSTGFGRLLGAAPVRRRLDRAMPVLGGCGALFGLWYGLGAASVLPYPL